MNSYDHAKLLRVAAPSTHSTFLVIWREGTKMHKKFIKKLNSLQVCYEAVLTFLRHKFFYIHESKSSQVVTLVRQIKDTVPKLPHLFYDFLFLTSYK